MPIFLYAYGCHGQIACPHWRMKAIFKICQSTLAHFSINALACLIHCLYAQWHIIINAQQRIAEIKIENSML
jgi:hypothetical protein